MTDENRRNTVKRNIELNKDDVDWFYSTFFGGNLSGLMSELLSEFRSLYDKPPAYYLELAAKSLKEKIDEK